MFFHGETAGELKPSIVEDTLADKSCCVTTAAAEKAKITATAITAYSTNACPR